MACKYSLVELLNLALGTPEIGAVNFNYLYEVIHEILKHLGIANKPAGAVEDFDYRIQSIPCRSTPEPEVKEEAEGLCALENSPGIKSSTESLVKGPDQPENGKAEKDVAEKRKRSPIPSSKKGRKANPKALLKEIEGKRPTANNEETQKQANSEFDVNVKEETTVKDNSPRQWYKDNQDIILANRMDQMGSDPASQKKSLDRRDSKTPAGDMWQLLNVNRRLDAAEAIIQGMTGLIDNLSTDIVAFKDVLKSNDIAKGSDKVEAEHPGNDQESDASTELFNQLKKSIADIESFLKTCATKTDIKDLCSISLAESMIQQRMSSQLAQPSNVKQSSTASRIAEQREPPSNTEQHEPPSNTQQSEPPSSAVQSPKRKESRTKLLQDAISRITRLEEGSSFMNEELERVNASLVSKADQEKQKENSELLKAEIERLNEEVLKLQSIGLDLNETKRQISKISGEIETLKYIIDQASKEQAQISKNFTKFDTVHMKMGSNANTQAVKSEQDAIAKLNTLLSGLQAEHSSLYDEFLDLRRETKKYKKVFESIENDMEDIKSKKVDKDEFEKMLDMKANKSVIEDKISQQQFDSCVGLLDKNLQDVLQRISGQETVVKQLFCKIETKLEKKINRDDLLTLKENMEDRLKTLKVSVPEPIMPEDGAAGFRKPLLRNFHCISCDRPLEMLQDDAKPTLPLCQALPGSRAIRPYTTFELEHIRKHIRGTGSNKDRFDASQERERLQKQLLRLCGVHDLDDLTARGTRSCGGSHTLLDPQKRTMVKTTLLYREDSLQIQAATEPVIEGDVMGRDGHIYKGRKEHLPPLVKKETPVPASQNELPIMERPSIQQSKTAADHQTACFAAQPMATAKTA